MNKGYKKILLGIICIVSVVTLSILPVSANSAQTEWEGKDSMGAAVIGGDCPVEVANEVLTFDVPSFPDYTVYKLEDLESYSAKVTAEYTFHNPTDLTVTAKLAFPFGAMPWYFSGYYDENSQFIEYTDTDKYGITVNGETVERNIRYTVEYAYDDFDIQKSVKYISDEYVSDGLFQPDATVTRYRYSVQDVQSLDNYNRPCAVLDWNGEGDGTYVCFYGAVRHNEKDGSSKSCMSNVSPGKSLVVYVIGEPLAQPLDFKFYNDFYSNNRKEISGDVTLIDTATMRFEDFVLEDYVEEETEISKTDWYNAVVSQYIESFDNGVFYSGFGRDLNSLDYSYEIMRWYEYEITLAPGESIVNTVTAPLYPDVSTRYSPPIYTYNYLLSPASTWASFGELRININTPYYIQGGSDFLGELERTDSGYRMSLDGLPDGEMTFTLCESENPERRAGPYAKLFKIVSIVAIYVIVAVPIVSIIAIVVMVKKRKS